MVNVLSTIPLALVPKGTMIYDHPFRQDMGRTGEGVSLLHVEGFCQVLGTIADGKCKTVPQRIQSRKQAPIFVSLIHFRFPCSRSYAQFPQAGNQVFLWPVALDAIAVGAEELQVVDMVVAAGVLGNDVVHLKEAELESGVATVATAFLLAEQDVLVLAIRDRRVNVGAPGYVGSAVTSRL